MNKRKLVAEVAEKTGLTKINAGKVVDGVVSVIRDTLAKGEKVTLVSFGTFQVIERKARKGVNPRTGEELQIPAKKVPKFVPGKSLKEKVK